MADKPEFPVNIPKDTWTKVATSVTQGIIWNSKTTSGYMSTWRATGIEDDPTDPLEGAALFLEHPEYEEINSSFPIDVWVYSRGKDGLLRLDL